METKPILLEVEDGVATIILNEPQKLNALSSRLVEEFKIALRRIESDSEIRSVVLTGSGRAFCAGGDISEFPQVTDENTAKEYLLDIHQQFFIPLASLKKPVIAAVNGHAIGAGFSLALACDIVLAAEDSSFAMSFNRVGLIPDLGAYFYLPRIVGLQRAKSLMLTGRKISPNEAKEYGIVFEVYPSEQLLVEANKLAIELANGPTLALGMNKTVLNSSFELTLQQVLNEEATAQGIAFQTEDHQEGVRSFYEKRNPQFKGR